ncbi:hypothetical protein [uncultured Mediterranean phage uvDeep-CGR2-KM21-C88]|nr:hypothetical protein [uncultured Mediterranean phage uvDeep-CGR2-KM21-C88]
MTVSIPDTVRDSLEVWRRDQGESGNPVPSVSAVVTVAIQEWLRVREDSSKGRKKAKSNG